MQYLFRLAQEEHFADPTASSFALAENFLLSKLGILKVSPQTMSHYNIAVTSAEMRVKSGALMRCYLLMAFLLVSLHTTDGQWCTCG